MFLNWMHKATNLLSRSSEQRPRPRARRKPFRPALEMLEERQLLATFTVNSADDDLGNAGLGVYTATQRNLLGAIELANRTPLDAPGVPHQIRFNIPGSGVHTIHIAAG